MPPEKYKRLCVRMGVRMGVRMSGGEGGPSSHVKVPNTDGLSEHHKRGSCEPRVSDDAPPSARKRSSPLNKASNRTSREYLSPCPCLETGCIPNAQRRDTI